MRANVATGAAGLRRPATTSRCGASLVRGEPSTALRAAQVREAMMKPAFEYDGASLLVDASYALGRPRFVLRDRHADASARAGDRRAARARRRARLGCECLAQALNLVRSFFKEVDTKWRRCRTVLWPCRRGRRRGSGRDAPGLA